MMPIHAVLFDYGMVLSGPPDPLAQARLEELLEASPESFRETYWEFRDAYDRGALSGVTYWTAVAERLERPVNHDLLRELIAADTALWTQPNAPMIEWAAALQQAGIKTGILSNLGNAMELGIRNRFAWLADFDHHTFSHWLGIAKPDTAIYRHAAEGLATPPPQILFVDDREENIRAAREAGMQAIQYSTHSAFVATMTALNLEYLLTPSSNSRNGTI
jgi:putative hydrolase of the HAD superfamily